MQPIEIRDPRDAADIAAMLRKHHTMLRKIRDKRGPMLSDTAYQELLEQIDKCGKLLHRMKESHAVTAG